MRFSWTRAGFLAVLLASAGCYERTEKVTLNPDGSGKCEMNLYVDPPLEKSEQTLDSQALARRVAMGLVRGSKGVDAWTGVSYEHSSDGRSHFMGTAYFKRLNEFKLQGADVPLASWKKDPAGGMTLTMLQQDTRQPTPPDFKITDDEVKQQIKESRENWEQQKHMTAAMLGKFKVDLTYLLPGKADPSKVFEAVPGGVRFVLEGKKVYDAMDKFIGDDAAMTAAAKAGRDISNGPDSQEKSEMIYGVKGPLSVHVAVDAGPQFDYAAEVADAKKVEMQMLNKIGLMDKAMPTLDAPLTPTTAP